MLCLLGIWAWLNVVLALIDRAIPLTWKDIIHLHADGHLLFPWLLHLPSYKRRGIALLIRREFRIQVRWVVDCRWMMILKPSQTILMMSMLVLIIVRRARHNIVRVLHFILRLLLFIAIVRLLIHWESSRLRLYSQFPREILIERGSSLLQFVVRDAKPQTNSRILYFLGLHGCVSILPRI